MKQFLVEAIILAFLVAVVMATAFRNQRARDALRFLRNAAWLYIAAIFLVGAIEIARRTL